MKDWKLEGFDAFQFGTEVARIVVALFFLAVPELRSNYILAMHWIQFGASGLKTGLYYAEEVKSDKELGFYMFELLLYFAASFMPAMGIGVGVEAAPWVMLITAFICLNYHTWISKLIETP